MLISLYNIAVHIIICRFESTLFLKYVNYFRDLGSSPCESQILHLFRCFLSSLLPLRSVGMSNFSNNFDSKRQIIIGTAMLYNESNSGQITKNTIYVYIYIHIHTYIYIYIVVTMKQFSEDKVLNIVNVEL